MNKLTAIAPTWVVKFQVVYFFDPCDRENRSRLTISFFCTLGGPKQQLSKVLMGWLQNVFEQITEQGYGWRKV